MAELDFAINAARNATTRSRFQKAMDRRIGGLVAKPLGSALSEAIAKGIASGSIQR